MSHQQWHEQVLMNELLQMVEHALKAAEKRPLTENERTVLAAVCGVTTKRDDDEQIRAD